MAELEEPRYIVGIDLGTSNSAVSYIDTLQEPIQVRLFPIKQMVAEGTVEHRDVLPSYLFTSLKQESVVGFYLKNKYVFPIIMFIANGCQCRILIKHNQGSHIAVNHNIS